MAEASPSALARSIRPQALAALLGAIAFLGAGATAALFYPGGTHWNHAAAGFQWTTFWCDLLRPIALNGESNAVGARAAQIALLALALGLGPFFAVAHALLDVSGWRRTWHLVGAYAGRIALVLVAAGTGRLPSAWHDWAILLGAPCGILALTMVVFWSARLDRRLALFGLAGLGLCLWNLGQYAKEALLHVPAWPGLPLVQKAATLNMIAFIVLLSVRGLRHSSDTDRATRS